MSAFISVTFKIMSIGFSLMFYLPSVSAVDLCTDNRKTYCPGTGYLCSCDTCYDCSPHGVACNCYNCGCYTKCNLCPPFPDGVYTIVNEYSNKALDCIPSPISTDSTHTSSSQKYQIARRSNGDGYTIRCLYNNYCWDYRWGDSKIGRERCSSTNGDQRYYFVERSQNSYEIVSVHSRYTEITSTIGGSHLITDPSPDKNTRQYFTVVTVPPLDDGIYYIINEKSNKPLDCVSNPVSIKSSTESADQWMQVTYIDVHNAHARYQVKCWGNSLCWDYRGGDRKIGREGCSITNADQWYKFRLRKGYSNSYEITGAYDRYLDVFSTTDGSQLSTDPTRDNAKQQYYTVKPVPGVFSICVQDMKWADTGTDTIEARIWYYESGIYKSTEWVVLGERLGTESKGKCVHFTQFTSYADKDWDYIDINTCSNDGLAIDAIVYWDVYTKQYYKRDAWYGSTASSCVREGYIWLKAGYGNCHAISVHLYSGEVYGNPDWIWGQLCQLYNNAIVIHIDGKMMFFGSVLFVLTTICVFCNLYRWCVKKRNTMMYKI